MNAYEQKNWIKLIAVFALGSFFMPLLLNAQEISTDEEVLPDDSVEIASEAGNIVEPPEGTVSCFDYYTFGSVEADLTAPVVSTVSGAPINFSGNLRNYNPYPVVDGSLYVKVFKSRGDENDGNGPDVVDEFMVRSGIVIPANGSVPVSFSWNVPSYATSGSYEIATFFTTSRKFNLLGLSFTDDIVGNTVPFQVVGEQNRGVSFSKDGVTIAGEPYLFAAFSPYVSGTDPVETTARVVNTTNTAQRAEIHWVVYQWDAQLRENAVQEQTMSVTVPANSSAPVSITVDDTNYPVYLVHATLSWQDTKSILGARFVREGVDRTRINFPGVTSYPLNAGEPATLFSCLHNSGSSAIVSGGRLELTLTDMNGNLIHEYTYDGDVTGDMMGVADEFIPEKNYDRFMLDARLYQNGEFVNEAHLVYDCNDITPGSCRLESKETVDFLSLLQNSFVLTGLGVGLVALLIILIIVWRFMNRKPKTIPPQFSPQEPSPPAPPQV